MIKRKEILEALWVVEEAKQRFDFDGNDGNYSPLLKQAIDIRDRLRDGEPIEDDADPVVVEPCLCFCHQYPENVILEKGVCGLCGHKNEDGTLLGPEGKCWFENPKGGE